MTEYQNNKKQNNPMLNRYAVSQASLTAGAERVNIYLWPTVFGGLFSAVLGGILWWLIVAWSDSENAYMAWGIGILCGMTVTIVSRGAGGSLQQIVALISSYLGILIGKYAFFMHLYFVGKAQSPGSSATDISILSIGSIQYFFEKYDHLAHPNDVIWLFLALVTAWRIPRSGLDRLVGFKHLG